MLRESAFRRFIILSIPSKFTKVNKLMLNIV
jgi:hypothetical protein